MIEENYCSFETAKLLKEKGFDEATRQYYKAITYLGTEANNVCIKTLDGIESEPFNNSIYGFDLNGEDTGEYACPTLQMAMKWLREKCVFITLDIISFNLNDLPVWSFDIWLNNNHEYRSSDYFDSYEQACETAIKYCLKHLL